MTLVAALLALIFAGLCLHGVRHHQFSDHGLEVCWVLSFIGLLTFFSACISWRLWRGSLSSNGVTLMPTWFIQMFGVYVLIGIAYVAYYNPKYWVQAAGAFVAYGMFSFPRHLAGTRRTNERISQSCCYSGRADCACVPSCACSARRH